MLDELTFKNKYELVDYLQGYIDDINCVDEFSVFAHQVNDYRDDLGEGNPHSKMELILQNGLSASKYGSIYGTLNFMGSSKDANTVERATDYNYHYSDQKACFFPTVLLAFPRFVLVDGKKVEYATSKYTSKEPHAHDMLVKLIKERDPYDFPPLLQHTPKCWADVLKGFNKFSTLDTLCAFYKDASGEYHLIFPHTHWAEQELGLYIKHKQKLATRIAEYNTDLDDAIITEIAKRHEIVWAMYDCFD